MKKINDQKINNNEKEKVYEDTKQTYSYYSRVLEKPFDSLKELAAAEQEYYDAQKAKEDKAAQKKADAQKVEDAFKALNAARKVYKEDLAQLTKEYSEELETLKKAFELGKKDIYDTLARAEEVYSAALKEFTTKYDSYHVTLRDGDFETTISGNNNVNKNNSAASSKAISDLFDLLFSF